MQFDIFGVPVETQSDSPEQAQIARNAAAAEHLICADLLRRGVDAFIVSGQRPYDIVVEAAGLFRLQVKSCSKCMASHGKYQFGGPQFSHKKRVEFRNRGRMNQNGLMAYKGLVDGMALVALDIMKIRYIPIENVSFGAITISAQEMESQQELSWECLAKAWGCFIPNLKMV